MYASRSSNRSHKNAGRSEGYMRTAPPLGSNNSVAQREINMFAVETAVSRTCSSSSLGGRWRFGRVYVGPAVLTYGRKPYVHLRWLIISRAHNATRRVLNHTCACHQGSAFYHAATCPRIYCRIHDLHAQCGNCVASRPQPIFDLRQFRSRINSTGTAD